VKRFSNKNQIETNLLDCFKGYTPRPIDKLKMSMLHMMSYSPDTILLNEHMTEAAMQDTLSRATEMSLSA
tara:strand:- start:929 stop:1138 length:210 start_codon:yes stop_codon:yes gene_type:complete